MSFHLVFLLSSYFLVFLGLIGLFFTGELSPPYLFLAGVSFVFGAWGEVQGRKEFLSGPVAHVLLLGILILTLSSIFILKALPLQELTHFLLTLQAVKLLAPKKGRDWLQLYLLSFFSLVSASALSVELSFAILFVCYLFAAPWVMVLFHLKGAVENAGKDPDREIRLLDWALARLVGGIGVVLLFLTLFLFLAIPRLRGGFLGDSWASGSAATGFSDRLALGEVAEIQKSGAVALRVGVDQPKLLQGRRLYWRGLALDLFDGRRWQRSTNHLIPLKRVGGFFLVGEWANKNGSPLIRQQILLEPTGSPTLFALDRPVALSGGPRHLFRDPLGNLSILSAVPFKISYEVLSYPAGLPEGPPQPSLLQLPAIDPRIFQLARRLTVGIGDPMSRARTLELFLRESYRYSLQGLPQGDKDPLAVFLFEVRQGNCEYFASALAVMLRSLGIPARVVNGYLGGEWNPYGEYYLVRQSDAHSWVEAYFAGQGWATLDPTPATAGLRSETRFSSLTHFIDSLRLRWYRYVIHFGFHDQYQLFVQLKRPHQWFNPRLRGFSSLTLKELPRQFLDRVVWWIGMALVLGTLLLAWKRLSNRKRGKTDRFSPSHQAAELYRRFLAFLRKRGLKKRTGETPDEFSLRAGREGYKTAQELTVLYQQIRFSGRSDFSSDLKRMVEILSELRK